MKACIVFVALALLTACSATPASTSTPTSAPAAAEATSSASAPTVESSHDNVAQQLKDGHYTRMGNTPATDEGGAASDTVRWMQDEHTFIDVSDKLSGGREFYVSLVLDIDVLVKGKHVRFWCLSTNAKNVAASVKDFNTAKQLLIDGASTTPQAVDNGISNVDLPERYGCYIQE